MANPHNPVTIVTGGGNPVTPVTSGCNPVTAVTGGGNLVTLTASGHNPVTFIGGIGVIQFEAPLTNSLIPETAIASTYTFTRNDTDATVTDFEGLVKSVTADEARFVGARRIENLVVDSEDFTNAGWTKTNTTAAADQLTATGGNATTLDAYTASAGDYVFSVDLKRVSGTGNIQIAADSGTYTTVTLTGTYQRFSVQQTVAAGAKNTGIRIVTSGDVINAKNAQLELVEGQANQNPSEYVSIGASDDHGSNQDGVKYFNTQNGNTVSSNVVTETTGSAIPAATLKGTLIEGSSTNLVLRSEEFDNAYWSKFKLILTANATTSPSGLTDAELIAHDDPTTAYSSASTTVTGLTGGQPYTLSLYAKENGSNILSLEFRGTGNTSNAEFNLTLGTITKDTFGTAKIEAAVNGWYRCSFTRVAADASEIPIIGMGGFDAAPGDSIYIWGAQLEQSTYPSSYIPTISATVTRNDEALSYPNTNILDAEGTLAFSFTANGDTSDYAGDGDRALIGVRGTDEDLIYIDSVSGKTAVADGTSTTTVTAMPALVSGATVKLAARWSATSSLMDIGQDTIEDQAAFDGSMNKSTAMRLGYSGADRGNGSIKSLRVYEEAVIDVIFASLTT